MNSPMKNSIKFLSIGAASLGILAGCSSDSDYNFESSELRQQQAAGASIGSYDPANGVLPLPNDLLFTGSMDGTLNIPVEDPTDYSNPRVAINTLDGWSTIEPIVASFVDTFAGNFGVAGEDLPIEKIDPESVAIADSVRVFEVTRTQQGAVTGVVAEVDATQILATVVPADPSTVGSQLGLVPLQPLKESTTYMALVTNGVKDVTGNSLARGFTYASLSGPTDLTGDAAALQGLIRSMLAAGAGAGVAADSVVLSWTFTTQSITPVLLTLKDLAVPTQILLQDTQVDTGALSPNSPDLADIFAGQMSVPYYLGVPSQENPLAPLQTFFTNSTGSFLTPLDNAPVTTIEEPLAIPVLMTKPKGEVPANGFPIAIFQHGITRSRADMLAIADSMAARGFATIAIDAPMHGISADDAAAGFRITGIERTFDVDFVDNATGAAGPDGNPDASGTHFYNLANLLNTRDNNRQAVADLFTLSASVSTIADIDASRKVFIGHSLGAILGTTFLAFDDSISTASLVVGGGGLPRILANSPSFGPRIAAGLAASGLDINSAEGNAFLNAAQTVVDSVDPINHAQAAGANTAVHMVQVNGDTVVINNVPGFPLVGTEPLARVMGLPPVTASAQGSGFVKFNTGYHSSLLSPADANPEDDRDAAAAAAVFQELQAQVATFALTVGSIEIGNPAIIEGATP